MRLNYNFAFKNSKLREWVRPSPPNLLVTDASIKKKIIYIYKEFNSNAELFYPPSLILIITIALQIFNLYPNKALNKLESDHNRYVILSNKLANLNSSKQRFQKNTNNLDQYFSQATTSYLFAFYLQNSVPKGVQLQNYSFSDNGFEINASAFSLDSLNEFITLIIESPIIERDSVTISQLNRKEVAKSELMPVDSTFDLQIYGEVKKLDIQKREDLYIESNANGLLKKLQRFNYLKRILGS